MSAEQTASAPARRRYSVAREGRGDDAKLVLDGGAGRSRAEIALRGANLFRWTLAQGERGQLDLIESPKKLADLAEDPWGRGTPVLAPFPNRVANAKFVWEGKTIELEPNFPGGHAIHGLVGPRRWEVETTEEEPDFARARLAFEWTLTEGPKTWPFRFRATLDVVLREGRVALELAVVNQSGRPMPVGLGLHPYFRLPFEDGKREDYLLTIPAHERWIVDNQVLPTGKRALLRDVENWAEGRRLYSTIKLDDLFGDLERTGRRGETVASLQWLLGERRLEIAGGDTVRHWQVYTPPRDSIAIEPQTCSIDAFNLAAQGVDSGMKILAPDETFSMRAAFSFLPPDRGHIAPKASAASAMSAPDDPVSMGPVMVAEGQTVSRGEFLPVRDLLLSLLAHRDEPFGRRLIAASAALDLLALYIPAAQQASQSAGQNASPVEAMGLFLQEMDAGGSDRLWSIAQKKISSPSAGKFCLVGVINGSHGAPSRSPTRAAWSLLALMGFSAANLAKVRFGPPPEPAFRVSQLLARRVDLDAPKPALVLEQRFLSLIKEGEWLDWEKTACWSFRRVVLLCGLIGWRAASLNEPGSDPAKLAAQAFAFVSERFGGPEGLEPAFHRWPVFEDSFRNWLKHTAFAPTMVELASKKS